jgi:predicted Zn-dependent protease with MMP-like domain
VDRQAFETIVRAVLEDLPERFRYALENVAIVVDEEPAADEAREHLEDGENELLGLYQGVPLTERDAGYTGVPDTVFLFRGPILRISETDEEVAQEIRDTLIHELGHHMGLGDDDMPY